MTPNEQSMWRDIAEAIEPYCVNGAGFIRESYEDEGNIGFYMETKEPGSITIGLIGKPELAVSLPVEEDLRIFNKDKPGYFEGMPIDGWNH